MRQPASVDTFTMTTDEHQMTAGILIPRDLVVIAIPEALKKNNERRANDEPTNRTGFSEVQKKAANNFRDLL